METDKSQRQKLVEQLRSRGIENPRVLAAMGSVPREKFVMEENEYEAYADCALPIDCGQTISQPFMVAVMTAAMELSGNEKVLEIGTGSGYQTAVLAELADYVVSIERHRFLSEKAAKRLDKMHYDNVRLLVGDGSMGRPDEAPFDRIMVTAASQECPPALFDQLVEGGIIVIPVGGRYSQTLEAVHKIEGQARREPILECRFVPLIGEQGW
ncbi:MAG: protein-L-isoaspartate(D-aspartate) O-methyltransferase [Pirellulales bacterium]|nr:protein-L-isoaspartate(D-aspartate) O-methyltransferase [Pirellulales bacterium]